MVVFVSGTAGLLLTTLGASPWMLDSSIDAPLRLLQQVGHAAVASMIIVAGHVFISWISPERGLLAKLKETEVALLHTRPTLMPSCGGRGPVMP